MSDLYFKALNKTVEDNSDHLLAVFTKKALISGWPEDLVSKIGVKIVDGNIAITHDQKLTQTISDLEYGTTSTPPRAAMRNFAAELDAHLLDILVACGIDAMFKRQVFS